jgi:hypothetical protein
VGLWVGLEAHQASETQLARHANAGHSNVMGKFGVERREEDFEKDAVKHEPRLALQA